ncbi:DUF2203 family protein [candidate division KSB1 bacterium]|nr:DUF2203 family protein [candidate division KSB1 bacterium]
MRFEPRGGSVNDYEHIFDDGMPRFTLEQANALLPKIIKLTEQAIENIQEARERMESEELFNEDDARQGYDVQVGLTLEKWEKHIRNLGAYPKGYFTVDFKSMLPDTLLCWTFGETQVRHTHKTWENFKRRRPIEHPEVYSFTFSLN